MTEDGVSMVTRVVETPPKTYPIGSKLLIPISRTIGYNEDS
ncbi:MAG: hypothetical protein JWO94_2910, partial [Verrucomicrobiaceae bacterium]|nr:hypothetical protein [Verrucomicrobiaceae bacterium]